MSAQQFRRETYLARAGVVKFILLLLLSMLFASAVLEAISRQLPTPPMEGQVTKRYLSGGVTALIEATVLGPFIETLIFQALPVWLLRVKCRRSVGVTCFVSAALFAAAHPYHVTYMAHALGLGGVLAFYYVARKDADKPAAVPVTVAHGLFNAVMMANVRFELFRW